MQNSFNCVKNHIKNLIQYLTDWFFCPLPAPHVLALPKKLNQGGDQNFLMQPNAERILNQKNT
jgi:hypothetical protein